MSLPRVHDTESYYSPDNDPIVGMMKIFCELRSVRNPSIQVKVHANASYDKYELRFIRLPAKNLFVI